MATQRSWLIFNSIATTLGVVGDAPQAVPPCVSHLLKHFGVQPGGRHCPRARIPSVLPRGGKCVEEKTILQVIKKKRMRQSVACR